MKKFALTGLALMMGIESCTILYVPSNISTRSQSLECDLSKDYQMIDPCYSVVLQYRKDHPASESASSPHFEGGNDFGSADARSAMQELRNYRNEHVSCPKK